MGDYSKEVITLRLDKQSLEEFTGYSVDYPQDYFKIHKKAKKPPMDSLWGKGRTGLIPSINKFLNCKNRVIQNQWEQHLKEYCEYSMRKQGLKHNYIEQCLILVVTYKPTRSKSDASNQYSKPFEDAMVERELIVDDNYTVVKLHCETMVYCKDDPHSEIRIYPINDTYDLKFALQALLSDFLEIHKKFN